MRKKSDKQGATITSIDGKGPWDTSGSGGGSAGKSNAPHSEPKSGPRSPWEPTPGNEAKPGRGRGPSLEDLLRRATGGNGGGFNGIGARWIARFMKDRNEQSAFEPWLQKNAEAAWPARRASDNLTWPRWPQPTPEGTRYSWGSSSAVVVLQVTPPTEPAKAEPEKVP